MKIQTGFDKTLKEVYHMLALPYPPRPIQSEELQVLEDEDEVEETAIQIKPFKPKFKSYNINKDELTKHQASKQLTRSIAELERKRRETEKNADVDANYMKFKENVVNSVNHLSSRAKVIVHHESKMFLPLSIPMSDECKFCNSSLVYGD